MTKLTAGSSDWVKNVKKNAGAVKDSHVSENGSDRGMMPAIQENISIFQDISETGEPDVQWRQNPGDYEVEEDVSRTNDQLSGVELRAELPGIDDFTVEGETLSQYLSEVDSKVTAIRNGVETARERRDQLQAGEDVAETDLLQSLLGPSTADYEDDPGQISESGAARHTGTLEEIDSIRRKGVPLLEDRIDELSLAENYLTSHAVNVADSYHADAKENIMEIAAEAEEAFETFAETVEAARTVSEYVDETLEHDNYDPGLGAEHTVRQQPVQEAAVQALNERAQEVADYMEEIDSGINDLEHAARSFDGFLEDTDEVENMKQTVQEYRQGMRDLAASTLGDRLGLEKEYGSVSGYVRDALEYTGMDRDWEIEDSSLELVSKGQEA